MKQLFSTVVFILFSIMIYSQSTIYVSTIGNDHNNGTEFAPVLSLNKAWKLAQIQQGSDTLFIKIASGNYEQNRPFLLAKNLNRPVVFQGVGSKKPLLSGGYRIKNFKLQPNGWWKCVVPEVQKYHTVFEQLYVNNKRAIRARTPDEKWFYLKGSKESVIFRGKGRAPEVAAQVLYAKPEDLSSLKNVDLSKEKVSALFYHKWDNTRKPLDYVKCDSGLICIHGEGMKPWNPIRKGARFILENYKEALSVEGEWYLSVEGDLFYIPRKGESIATAEVYAPTLRELIHIEGTTDEKIEKISFRNLAFAHSAFLMPANGNEPEQSAASVNAAIMIDHAEEIHFDNCEIQHTGNYAIWFRKNCSNSSATHCYLNDLGAGGIKIGENSLSENQKYTHHIVVENNIIHHTGMVFPCGVGVAIFHAHNNKILHNEISDLRYTAISVGWIWGYADSPAHHNEIAYNHMHHIGWGELSDMGAVYTLGHSPGTHIHHNVIHDVYSYDYGGWGLYTDEGSSQIVMENNLVYACKSGGFHQHYGKENRICNNIFAFGHYFQVQFTRVEKHRSLSFTNNIILMDCGAVLAGAFDKANLPMDYNCYWDLRKNKDPLILGKTFRQWKKFKEPHSIWADPQFVAPLKGDFQFKNKRSIRRIKFKPFDYTQAGVYGTSQWKEKAKMDKEARGRFKEIVLKREKTHSGFYSEK